MTIPYPDSVIHANDADPDAVGRLPRLGRPSLDRELAAFIDDARRRFIQGAASPQVRNYTRGLARGAIMYAQTAGIITPAEAVAWLDYIAAWKGGA